MKGTARIRLMSQCASVAFSMYEYDLETGRDCGIPDMYT